MKIKTGNPKIVVTTNAWTDEAREASIAARRASSKAHRSGQAEDHADAAKLHRIAADKLDASASDYRSTEYKHPNERGTMQKQAGEHRQKAEWHEGKGVSPPTAESERAKMEPMKTYVPVQPAGERPNPRRVKGATETRVRKAAKTNYLNSRWKS